jgi:hypothetical protein
MSEFVSSSDDTPSCWQGGGRFVALVLETVDQGVGSLFSIAHFRSRLLIAAMIQRPRLSILEKERPIDR